MSAVLTRAIRCGLAAGALALLAAAPAAETGDLDALRTEALELVNAARGAEGRPPLTPSDTLNLAAQDHAEDMLARDYLAHVSPEGEDARDRYIARGGDPYELVGENIAACAGCAEVPGASNVEQMQARWMDSPHHRENILLAGVTKFGYGIVAGEGGRLYAVQTFAGPGSPRDATAAAPAAPPAAPPAGAAAPDQGEMDDAFVDALNARREAEARPALALSADLSAAAADLLPETADEQVDGRGLSGALPGGWTAVSAIVGSCGGCGAEVAGADVEHFLAMWLQEPAYAERLLAPEANSAGFALRAYGDGRKLAVAVVGARP